MGHKASLQPMGMSTRSSEKGLQHFHLSKMFHDRCIWQYLKDCHKQVLAALRVHWECSYWICCRIILESIHYLQLGVGGGGGLAKLIEGNKSHTPAPLENTRGKKISPPSPPSRYYGKIKREASLGGFVNNTERSIPSYPPGADVVVVVPSSWHLYWGSHHPHMPFFFMVPCGQAHSLVHSSVFEHWCCGGEWFLHPRLQLHFFRSHTARGRL